LFHRVEQKHFEIDPHLFLLGSLVEDAGLALSTLLDWIYKADDLTESRVLLPCLSLWSSELPSLSSDFAAWP